MFCCRLLTSFNFNIIFFQKQKIRNTIKMSNGPENRLDSDQNRDYGGPDLGPN